MRFLKLIPILFLLFEISLFRNSAQAEVKNSEDYKVLSISNKKQTCIHGLPIADINIPTLPKEYLKELIKKRMW